MNDSRKKKNENSIRNFQRFVLQHRMSNDGQQKKLMGLKIKICQNAQCEG